MEAPEGQTHQYGYADFCVTQTDNDENYCYCFTPEGFYRRQDGSEMELSERLDKSDTLRKPVEKGAVTVPGGSMLYTLIFHGLGIPEEFTIVFGDISVDGKSLTLEPLKFRKKFKKFHYVPISRYG